MKLPSFSLPLTGAVLCSFTMPLSAVALLPKQVGLISEKDIHHAGWIDFNKDGKKDVFDADNPHIATPAATVRALDEVQRWFNEETRLGIPVEYTNEGIRGTNYRKSVNFPANISLGATWNRELVTRVGAVVAREEKAIGYRNVYAPLLDPRWGRVVECNGEDPYHVAELGLCMARAIRSAGKVDPNGFGNSMAEGALYPFGFGLSYTTFGYSGLKVSPAQIPTTGEVTVTCEIKDIGDREGDEVAQSYFHQETASVTTYELNLCGFERIHLKPGETRSVRCKLPASALELINREGKRAVDPGTFKLTVGSSSANTRLTGAFEVMPAKK